MARRLRVHPKVPLILMYHRINEVEADPWGLVVSPRVFDEQLESLKHRRLVLPLVEFGRLHRHRKLPATAVSITFDDGYACNALAAAPLLEKHGLPATIFLTTGSISSSEEFWWDALERIMTGTHVENLDLSINKEASSIFLGERDEASLSSNWDATCRPASIRQAAYLKLWTRLRDAEDGERRQAMAALHRQADIPALARPSHRVMTAAEARRISSSGLIEIGAHTVTHPMLSRLAHDEQLSEITRSREACRELVGYEPRAFAYPYGDYDNSTAEITGDAGFEIGCTTCAAGVGPRTQPLTMPRLQVRAWSSSELAATMGALDHE
jgi:peptidoglycan/xylan/chitin deacetylase (PgdA/CDA1 family)